MLDVRPSSAALGAEIAGVDLSGKLLPKTVADIYQALLDNLVIVFRQQTLTVEQLKSFARRFGALHTFTFVSARSLPGHPEVLRVIKEPADRTVFGGQWHSDVTFLDNPVMGSILHAIETPQRGGDTLFANMYGVYESLPDDLKASLEGTVAVHETSVPPQGAVTDRALDPNEFVAMGTKHPVVRVHPDTKRKLLYVNKTYTTKFHDRTEQDSRPLLEFLFDHAKKPEHVWRLHWTPGTVAFWDNRCTQHLPLNDYHGYRRLMHRVAIEGLS